jgi:hypothetical protein
MDDSVAARLPPAIEPESIHTIKTQKAQSLSTLRPLYGTRSYYLYSIEGASAGVWLVIW